MNFIKEIYHSMISGWHEGKGHKNSRKGNFEKALNHYNLALKFTDNDGGTSILIECIARTYARLDNLNEALKHAETSLQLLREFENTSPVFDKSIKRVNNFIEILKNNDKEAIKRFVAI
jgi:tetratricopeptide (TPR) repeat protein